MRPRATTTSTTCGVARRPGRDASTTHQVRRRPTTLAGHDAGRRRPSRPGASPGRLPPAGRLRHRADPIGDEDIVNFDVPAFRVRRRDLHPDRRRLERLPRRRRRRRRRGRRRSRRRRSRTRPGRTTCSRRSGPTSTAPAPPGILAATLDRRRQRRWLVVEWRRERLRHQRPAVFQVWIGLNGTEDISFAYDPGDAARPPVRAATASPSAPRTSTARPARRSPAPPTGEDLRVTTSGSLPGGSLTYSYTVRGLLRGTSSARTDMTTPLVRGTTTEVDEITVNR